MRGVFYWWFNTIPDPQEIERFYESQVPLFARNAKYLTGNDGQLLVDTMIVTHDNGIKNVQFEFNGLPGHMGDLFCFPGYFPGDKDKGQALFNICDCHEYYYGKVVSAVLSRAHYAF